MRKLFWREKEDPSTANDLRLPKMVGKGPGGTGGWRRGGGEGLEGRVRGGWRGG